MNLVKNVTGGDLVKPEGSSTIQERSTLGQVLQYVSANVSNITMVDGTPSSTQQAIDGVGISPVVAMFILTGVDRGV